jgi:hypothetical protein
MSLPACKVAFIIVMSDFFPLAALNFSIIKWHSEEFCPGRYRLV